MADDTQDESANTPIASAVPPKKYPKGVILGKDGKPCRTCNSLTSFTSTTKSLQTPSASPPTDCPPSIETLGRASWTFLHTLSASYPSTPTPSDRTNISTFMNLFAQLYPCWTCAEDFQSYMAENKVRTESRAEFGMWMCEAHNDVNRKLGKREFDCARWEERWRTGWKDGRCG
ncbi:Bcerv1 [Botrytis cinerea B05.10]|uniref:Sulfhydryl oxidase n=2 Tax=Botryotinia fuckeliana TaxID=40559 RepID=A0A384J9W1_BOTFB|nr:Bcerv1 [Botrytis cinerea B05.10]ATZ47217.1 Bcerv1 [Botrytis cinerea B05.10]CCD34476.1 similar to mitochondrial FAD-linked sulfhydryl oxidase ERV1 [Botrytis cinerea T4]